jgi:hypothetical protein
MGARTRPLRCTSIYPRKDLPWVICRDSWPGQQLTAPTGLRFHAHARLGKDSHTRWSAHAHTSNHALKPPARPYLRPRLSWQRFLGRPRSLPLSAFIALTSTVGIGAASCSGVKVPNSSASTSMPLTTKEEAGRTFSHTFTTSKQTAARLESGARRPKLSPLLLFTVGASERFRLLPARTCGGTRMWPRPNRETAPAGVLQRYLPGNPGIYCQFSRNSHF